MIDLYHVVVLILRFHIIKIHSFRQSYWISIQSYMVVCVLKKHENNTEFLVWIFCNSKKNKNVYTD